MNRNAPNGPHHGKAGTTTALVASIAFLLSAMLVRADGDAQTSQKPGFWSRLGTSFSRNMSNDSHTYVFYLNGDRYECLGHLENGYMTFEKTFPLKIRHNQRKTTISIDPITRTTADGDAKMVFCNDLATAGHLEPVKPEDRNFPIKGAVYAPGSTAPAKIGARCSETDRISGLTIYGAVDDKGICRDGKGQNAEEAAIAHEREWRAAVRAREKAINGH
jgi:hypothetical protein